MTSETKWEAVIGLEVHVQLATESKIFSDCPTGFCRDANVNIDPVSTGQPGVLPVLNRRAVELALKAAMAVNCQIRQRSIFARKHYFYPDLPKAYQISQYDQPYAEHGWLDIEVEAGTKRIGITRIHMEEDAGKSLHGEKNEPYSFVDYNRAGAPLIEIVSEPELRSAAEAGAYLRQLHTIIRYLDVSDADMEKGNFRCDANVSIRPKGTSPFGTKAELKNINSFRFIEKAIDYEIERQIAVIESGGAITQETRLWDAERQKTFSMREKESAHDYRYFPDPDLPPLVIESSLMARIQAEIPELPAAKKQRFVSQLGLNANDAATLANDRELADYFEKTAQVCGDANSACHWVVNEVLAGLPTKIEAFPVSAERLGHLIGLVKAGTVNTKTAKSIFLRMHDDDRDAATIVEAEGLGQISDDAALDALVQQIVAAHPAEVERYRAGDKKLFGFFMGQVMAASKGKANPATAKPLLQARLDLR